MDLTPAENRMLTRMVCTEDGIYPAHLLEESPEHHPGTYLVRRAALDGLLAAGLVETLATGEFRITETGRAECVPFEHVYPGLVKYRPEGDLDA